MTLDTTRTQPPRRLIATLALCACLAAAASAAAQAPPLPDDPTAPGNATQEPTGGRRASPTEFDIELAFDETGQADATMRQSWEGEDGKGFRQSLDVYFGAADGTLTEDDVERIVNATEADLAGQPLAWIMLDDEPSNVTDAQVELHDAAGATTSQQPVMMTHTLRLDLAGGRDLAGADHVLSMTPPWAGTLRLQPPEEWAIQDVQGADNWDESGEITFQGESDVTITFGNATAPTPASPTGEGAPTGEVTPPGAGANESTQGPQESGEPGGNGIPMGGGVVLLALAGAAALAARRRGR